MGVYVIGLTGVIVFYVAVLGVGIWAAVAKKKKSRHGQDGMILANRGLGPVLGIFTLIGEFYKLNELSFFSLNDQKNRVD